MELQYPNHVKLESDNLSLKTPVAPPLWHECKPRVVLMLVLILCMVIPAEIFIFRHSSSIVR